MGTVAEFAGNLGPLLGVVGGVIAMPLLWKGVDDQNLTNGRLEGLWDAMQDMASGFPIAISSRRVCRAGR